MGFITGVVLPLVAFIVFMGVIALLIELDYERKLNRVFAESDRLLERARNGVSTRTGPAGDTRASGGEGIR